MSADLAVPTVSAAAPRPPAVPVRIEQADGQIVTVDFDSLDVIRTDHLGCGCRRWSCVRPGGGVVHLFTNPRGYCYHGDVHPSAGHSIRPHGAWRKGEV